MLSLGMVLATNQYLMAAIDPMEGISSLESFIKKLSQSLHLSLGSYSL